ncbi:uncharacterized protein LOC107806727 isoform X1 [Nicotiana tabacum]|uniref:Uncharacterized protein LOC107806727 isoform X1 n=1 Tax=Nicotiana tabacum TaxID=4097 RepID=A0AC58TLY0_TOBAC
MTNDNVNQVVPMVTSTASTSRTTPAALAPAEKPEKFSGIDFKRWQQKKFFYLTTLSLQMFIKEDVHVLFDETLETERFLVIEAWKHSDFLCKNYILSGLEDALYNIYSGVETSKELWTTLEKKYKIEDAGLKKFVAAKFLDYKMVDIKFVITQVQELQVIIHDLLAEGLVINEAFQVEAMIEKLPPLWKDFKNYLKHKRKEMSLKDLIVRLRIEEDNKAAEKRGRENSTIMRANIIEENKKRKKSSGPKYNPSKKRFSGIATTVEKSDTNLWSVMLRRKTRRRVKQTWLKSMMMLMTCVPCFPSATWWAILKSGGLILEPLAMFVLLEKLLLLMLLLDPMR